LFGQRIDTKARTQQFPSYRISLRRFDLCFDWFYMLLTDFPHVQFSNEIAV